MRCLYSQEVWFDAAGAPAHDKHEDVVLHRCKYKPEGSALVNILLITNSCIGDTILTTGIINYFLHTYQQASITVACSPALAPLFEAMPGLKRIISMPRQGKARRWWRAWSHAVRFQWDIVIDFRRSALSYLVRTRKRFVPTRLSLTKHIVVEFAEQFGLPTEEATQLTLWIPETAKRRAEEIINLNQPLLFIAPVAQWEPKEWPMERFAAVATQLTGKNGLLPDAVIAVAGAPSDHARTRDLFLSLPENRRLDLVGTEDLPTIFAILKSASLFIGNDSGLMHAAAAMGCPTLGLFGPSNEQVYGPFGANALAVRTQESVEQLRSMPLNGQCLMLSLGIESVLDGASKLLNKS